MSGCLRPRCSPATRVGASDGKSHMLLWDRTFGLAWYSDLSLFRFPSRSSPRICPEQKYYRSLARLSSAPAPSWPSFLPCPRLLRLPLPLVLALPRSQGPSVRPFQSLPSFDWLLGWLPRSSHRRDQPLECLERHFRRLRFSVSKALSLWWGTTFNLGISCPFLIDHSLTIWISSFSVGIYLLPSRALVGQVVSGDDELFWRQHSFL